MENLGLTVALLGYQPKNTTKFEHQMLQFHGVLASEYPTSAYARRPGK